VLNLHANCLDRLREITAAALPHVQVENNKFITPDSYDLFPRWTGQNRPFVDTSKPAISGERLEASQFYFVPSSVRKSVCTFVRQLRGPHFRTWA
jgi:hypothetical protein